MKRFFRGLLTAALALSGSWAWAQGTFHACGDARIEPSAGPYDYRTKGQHAVKFQTIEGAHFPAHVEQLIRGNSTANVGGDIDYTLRAIPNHHRALVSVVNLGAREKTPQPKGMQYSIYCYFDRAVRYTPDEIVVRLLFAQYLGKQNRQADALAQVEAARSLAGDSGLSQYNIGLVLAEMKQYDEALVQAHKAMALGFTRTALKEQLVAAGRWRDPPPPAQGAAPSASQPASSPTPQESPASAAN